MEQLLRDGGDLDSMDRSLLDYNAMKSANAVKCGGVPPLSNATTNGNSMPISSPTGMVPNLEQRKAQLGIPPPQSSNHSSNRDSSILSPATPPVSPISPLPPPPMLQDGAHSGDLIGDLLLDATNVVKKDLVVRFTEQQNAVHHFTSTTSSDTTRNLSGGGNTLKQGDLYTQLKVLFVRTNFSFKV